MLTLPPRDRGRIISSPQEMAEFEKEEMKKSRTVVKNKLNERYYWLVDYVPKPIKNTVSEAFLRGKNSILQLYDGAKKTLKGDVKSEAEKKIQEEDIDLTPHEHERALKGAYRSFVIPGAPKTDIDSYFDQSYFEATHQDVNQKPAEGNGVCKNAHDPMGKMEEAYNATH